MADQQPQLQYCTQCDHLIHCPRCEVKAALREETKDPHWPYTRFVDGDMHRDCGGQLRYCVLNDDHDDRRYRCDKCNKTWVEEGADS